MTSIDPTAFSRFTNACRWACFAAGLLMGGCSHAARKDIPVASPAPHRAAITGISACDSYLDSYVACHRAAGIYKADVLQAHYQDMAQSLRSEASDAQVRPYLAKRCMGLAQQLNAALNGRTCTMPAASSTSPATVATPATH